ncbi:snRNA-activating protein complex subunit 4-like [Cynoglossus semilaevis]|uniref:snRNA-activating protein complex subunit 4-like n=1 Tax=Cynoglossus semilaevis TaxID=244447 RepID=UPI000D631709|nr:snRNA-activating protein complex subunit 4-like [Cynoglossus semilaevis]
MYLGRFLKPYFKDKLTGLGSPANQETRDKASKLTGFPDDDRMKTKRYGKDSLHVSPDVPALCLEDSETHQLLHGGPGAQSADLQVEPRLGSHAKERSLDLRGGPASPSSCRSSWGEKWVENQVWTDTSCRDRYYDTLKSGTKRGTFSEEEKELLRTLVRKHGVGTYMSRTEVPVTSRNVVSCQIVTHKMYTMFQNENVVYANCTFD